MMRDLLSAVEANPTLNLRPNTYKPSSRIEKLTDNNIRIRRVVEEIYLPIEPDDRCYA